MFRIIRSLYLTSKEYSVIQGAYACAPPKQYFSEYAEAKPKGNAEENLNSADDRIKKTKIKSKIDVKYLFAKSKHVQNLLIKDPFSEQFSSSKSFNLNDPTSCRKAIQLMKSLINNKNRPAKFLQTITDGLFLSSVNFDVKSCSDIFYCLASLSVKNEDLLRKISHNLLHKKNELDDGVIPANILQSLGILKYRNCEVIDVLAKKIMQKQNERKIQEMLTAFMTLCVVNYWPSYAEDIIKELLQCSKTDFQSTKSYLDFVWACVLSQKFPENHIAEVLSTDFLDQLTVTGGLYGSLTSLYMKLLNISEGTSCFLPSYSGPLVKNITYSYTQKKSKFIFLTSVVDSLSHIFPKEGYLLTNVDTKAGFILDVECYLDSKGNPIPLKKKSEGKKIGILLLTYNDYCLGSDYIPDGFSNFKERILQAKGYTVMKINYLKYNNNVKLFEKVNYLRDELNACK